jgi:molecular chaperone HscA
MALLQISEPGQTPDPHQRRVAVGIDLGTTHSLVAAMRHGAVECLPDDEGRVILPSAVRYLPAGRRQIGFGALAAQAEDPTNTVVSVKRLMGRSIDDVDAGLRQSYHLVPRSGMVALRTVDGDKTPVDVSAEILASLRQRAEDTFNDDLFGAVITVPAYFDDAQRQATKDAAQMAGLNVLRLINEPTAAAVAYGLENASEGLYAIYDLGGGTFDVSLLRLSRGVFEVVATGGDPHLGGDDFDERLAQAAWQAWGRTPSGASQRRAVLVAARACKEALSEAASAEIDPAVLGSEGVGLSPVGFSREAFESLTQDLLDRTLRSVRQVLRDAEVRAADVQGTVLVGGSTRMPMVRQAVERLFGRTPLTDVNPDEVVALGAALQANALAGNDRDGQILLLDVIPLSLGLETMGGLVERVIERNTTIPVAKAQEFTTYQDGQTAMAIHVVQGERELVSDCRSLARFELRGIPPMAAGVARIRVTFQVDADGLLSVSAQEMSTGVQTAVVVKPSYGLADEDVARMLQEGFSHAQDDMQARKWRESSVEADRMVLATRSALQADGDLLSDQERADVEALVAEVVKRVAQQASADDIDRAVEDLAKGTESFAAQRMNRGIRQALAGRRVEEV